MADILECGCGDGWLSLSELNLPQTCRSLTGIDISEVAIAKAIARSEHAGPGKARFLVMPVEAMTFPDRSFDVVFGRGILHHLDLNASLPEIGRVMRPRGIAIFSEPMGHNPIINFYRHRTPDLRTADEHPLRMADLTFIRQQFPTTETYFYGLFSAASVLFDRSAAGLPYRVGKAIDARVLRLPFVRRYAWHCLIAFRRL